MPIRRRSARDSERLQYEAGRAAALLRLDSVARAVSGDEAGSAARRRVAEDIENALDGKPTGFDWAGGRAEWLKQQK